MLGSSVLAVAKSKILNEKSDSTKRLKSKIIVKELIYYKLYKDIISNLNKLIVTNLEKNNNLFNPDLSNTVIQLITDLSRVFKMCDNKKLVRSLLNK